MFDRKIYWFPEVPTQDKPTNNCLWEIHSFLKSMLTRENV